MNASSVVSHSTLQRSFNATWLSTASRAWVELSSVQSALQYLSRPTSSSSIFSLPTDRRIRSTTAHSARRSSSSRRSYRTTRWLSTAANVPELSAVTKNKDHMKYGTNPDHQLLSTHFPTDWLVLNFQFSHTARNHTTEGGEKRRNRSVERT